MGRSGPDGDGAFDAGRLRHLVARLCDGRLDEAGEAELNGLLATGAAARREYLRLMDLHVELGRRGEAGEGAFGVGARGGSRGGAGGRTVPMGVFAATLAAAACLVGAVWWWDGGGPAVERVPVASVGYASGVVWDVRGVEPVVGAWVPHGEVLLEAGELGLVFVNGAEVSLRAPAVFSIESALDLIVEEGQVAAVVPETAAGFTVRNASLALVDIGTSFSMEVRRGGSGDVVVHDGEVVASLLGADGSTLRDFTALAGEGLRIDAGRGEIGQGDREVAFRPLPMAPAPLRVGRGYVDAVLADGPAGYWRFEAVVDGRIEDEADAAGPLEVGGVLELAGADGNLAAVFPGGSGTPELELEEVIRGLNGEAGYTLELWFYPGSRQFSTLLGVFRDAAPGETEPAYLSVLEQTGRANSAGGVVHAANRLRFLHRVPPAGRGGFNAFSEAEIVPRRWYHLVAVQDGERMRIYLNGELEREVAHTSAQGEDGYRLVVGSLRPPGYPVQRAFVGRIDEVAVYRRALRKDEVRGHYDAVKGKRGDW